MLGATIRVNRPTVRTKNWDGASRKWLFAPSLRLLGPEILFDNKELGRSYEDLR
jgi:hypothetical protein